MKTGTVAALAALALMAAGCGDSEGGGGGSQSDSGLTDGAKKAPKRRPADGDW